MDCHFLVVSRSTTSHSFVATLSSHFSKALLMSVLSSFARAADKVSESFLQDEHFTSD